VEVVQALSNPSNQAYHLISTWDGTVTVPPVALPSHSVRSRPPQVQNRLSTDLIDELVAAFQGGATHSELAAQFNIARTTVISHLKRAGVRRSRNGIPTDLIGEAAHLYRDGCSLADLGERYGVNPKTVWAALRKAGVSIRPRRGWWYPGDSR
jgi:DNA-binding CsgD family transcriptional regulator